MANNQDKLDKLQDIATDTNLTAKRIDVKTETSRTKRMSAFALVLLLLYFLVTLGLTVKDLNTSVRNLNKAVPALTASNKNLTDTNKNLTDSNSALASANARALAERNAAVNIAVEQARRLREAGLPAVDPFDPEVCCPSEPFPPSAPSGQTRSASPKASRSGSGPSKPSPSPSPQTSAKPTPAPSKSPLASICAPGLPCVEIPPLGTGASLSVAPTVLNQGESVEYDFFNMDPMTTVKLISAFLPLLVAVITKRYATSAVKGVANFVLSTATGSIGYLVGANGGYDLRGFINAALNCVVVSGIAYLMVWKPTGVAGSVAVATESLPGIGKQPTLTTDSVGKEDTGRIK